MREKESVISGTRGVKERGREKEREGKREREGKVKEGGKEESDK